MEAQVTGLLLHESVDAVHALTGHIVIEDDHVAVELAGPLPHSVDVVPAAHGMVAHDALFGEEGQVLNGLFRVGGGDHVVTHGGVHIQHDIDAPAVLDPGGEICVIHRGGPPQECPVAGSTAERLILPFVGLQHELQHLAVVFSELVLLAVDRGPGI